MIENPLVNLQLSVEFREAPQTILVTFAKPSDNTLRSISQITTLPLGLYPLLIVLEALKPILPTLRPRHRIERSQPISNQLILQDLFLENRLSTSRRLKGIHEHQASFRCLKSIVTVKHQPPNRYKVNGTITIRVGITTRISLNIPSRKWAPHIIGTSQINFCKKVTPIL